jgi:hypothetical protein
VARPRHGVHIIGVEAIDEDGLNRFRKRVALGQNFEALEFARSLGVNAPSTSSPRPTGTTTASA